MVGDSDKIENNTVDNTTFSKTMGEEEDHLDWSTEQKNYVLGAFFYGYFVMQASIEFICHKFSKQ